MRISSTARLLFGYGGLAALVLGCLWLISLAPLRLNWGRELVGAAIATVALGIGLRLAGRRDDGAAVAARTASPPSSRPDAGSALAPAAASPAHSPAHAADPALAAGTEAAPAPEPAAIAGASAAGPAVVASTAAPAPPAGSDASAGIAPAGTELSQREREVLRQLAQGLSNKQIARALSLSENTIKTHLANVYAKLGVNRRTEALKAAQQLGLA